MLKMNSALSPHRNEKIVVYADKGFSSYAAIFSILLSGNVWIPLSLEIPETRLVEILKQVKPKLILSNLELPLLLDEYAKDNAVENVNMDKLISGNDKRVFKDIDFKKDDIAYIMFTSGSTGVPKGVPMTHENYINFINNCMEILPFKKGDVFSDYHDFAFDISIFYLFCCPLNEGAFAPVMNESDKIVPLRFMQENEVTVWSSVPSVISRIKSLNPEGSIATKIRIMFLCGEPFSMKVLSYCIDNMAVPNIYNFYGLTETGVENFYHKCSKEDLAEYEQFGFVPIGEPLKGNTVRVTGDKELLLSGCQITPGYLGGVGADRFEVIDGVSFFHTGDIVEQYNEVFFCKGRMDSQVKLKGYRVELMDIEVHMKRFPGIDEAVCFVHKKRNKNVLSSVVKPKNNAALNTGELMRYISGQLPHYMVPSRIIIQDEIPVNRNGKIDRKKIREMHEEA
jgi:acyl-coenzyme A synthetase/AMP-(fatty) acid ligase